MLLMTVHVFQTAEWKELCLGYLNHSKEYMKHFRNQR